MAPCSCWMPWTLPLPLPPLPWASREVAAPARAGACRAARSPCRLGFWRSLVRDSQMKGWLTWQLPSVSGTPAKLAPSACLRQAIHCGLCASMAACLSMPQRVQPRWLPHSQAPSPAPKPHALPAVAELMRRAGSISLLGDFAGASCAAGALIGCLAARPSMLTPCCWRRSCRQPFWVRLVVVWSSLQAWSAFSRTWWPPRLLPRPSRCCLPGCRLSRCAVWVATSLCGCWGTNPALPYEQPAGLGVGAEGPEGVKMASCGWMPAWCRWLPLIALPHRTLLPPDVSQDGRTLERHSVLGPLFGISCTQDIGECLGATRSSCLPSSQLQLWSPSAGQPAS